MYPDGCTTSLALPVWRKAEGSFRPEHFGGSLYHRVEALSMSALQRGGFRAERLSAATGDQGMVRDLNLPIEVLSGEIIRDQDGLAMSSRNRYLSVVERENALCIPKALRSLQDDVQSGVTSLRNCRNGSSRGLKIQKRWLTQFVMQRRANRSNAVSIHWITPLWSTRRL